MNLEKTAINDRIAALMKDNKSIDDKLKYTSPESLKKALKAKKAKNNNELRQERTKRYNLEQLRQARTKRYNLEQEEDAEFIRECCQYLQKLGIVKSQRQFSQQFLNKSQDYLGMLICERRQPPINILHRLIQNLIQIQPIYEEKYTISNYLDTLINKGNQIITQRLLKYL